MIYKYRKDMPDKILVSHEKNLLRISVPTKMDGREIRLLLDRMADRAGNVFVPSEMVKESYGYTFYIRQRHSLKEYLINNSLGFDQYTQLMKEIIALKLLADEMDICIYHFLFDYDTIFTERDMDSLAFLYTPCDVVEPGENSISEMLTILSLHLSNQEEYRAIVEKSIRLIADWEAEPGRAFPLTELNALFQLDKVSESEKKQSWRPFLLFQAAALIVFLLFNIILPMGESGLYFILAWLLLVVCVDFFLVPGLRTERRRSDNKSDSLYLWIIGRRILKKYKIGQGETTLRIGRDRQWANVAPENLLVSRRHAEIFCREGSLFLRDLNSKNGTYLNKQRILPEEPVRLERGTSVCSIGEATQSYSIKLHMTRFSLSAMLKYLKTICQKGADRFD